MARVAPADDLLIGSLVSSYWFWLEGGGTLRWWFRKKSPWTGYVLDPLLLLVWGPRKAVCALDPSLLFLKPGMGLAFGSFYYIFKSILPYLLRCEGVDLALLRSENPGERLEMIQDLLILYSSLVHRTLRLLFHDLFHVAHHLHPVITYIRNNIFERRPLTVFKQGRNKNLLSIVLLLVGVDGKIWTHHLLR